MKNTRSVLAWQALFYLTDNQSRSRIKIMNEKEILRAHFSKLGKKGGKKGGKARMAEMTAEQRSALAKKAAAARWKKPK
jgi:hypothetical protein